MIRMATRHNTTQYTTIQQSQHNMAQHFISRQITSPPNATRRPVNSNPTQHNPANLNTRPNTSQPIPAQHNILIPTEHIPTKPVPRRAQTHKDTGVHRSNSSVLEPRGSSSTERLVTRHTRKKTTEPTSQMSLACGQGCGTDGFPAPCQPAGWKERSARPLAVCLWVN